MASAPTEDAASAKRQSINTPPDVSKAAMARVREEGRGQYAVDSSLDSGFVDVDGVKVHVVQGGDGDPIVFVHGFGSTWKMWEPVLKHFSRSHRVIAIDLPGLGQSGPSQRGYNSPEISRYILAAVRKLVGEGRFQYVCHDLGNSISYPLVAEHQGVVTKAVFMDSPIPDKAFWTYPGLTPTGPGLGWHFGFFVFGDIAEKLIVKDPMLFFEYFIMSYAGRKLVFTEELLTELVEPYSRLEQLHAAFSGYYTAHSDQARVNEALLASGQQLGIPSMAISGEKGVDEVLPKQMLARFVQEPSNFQAHILQGCGHWLVEECASEVIEALGGFLD